MNTTTLTKPVRARDGQVSLWSNSNLKRIAQSFYATEVFVSQAVWQILGHGNPAITLQNFLAASQVSGTVAGDLFFSAMIAQTTYRFRGTLTHNPTILTIDLDDAKY